MTPSSSPPADDDLDFSPFILTPVSMPATSPLPTGDLFEQVLSSSASLAAVLGAELPLVETAEPAAPMPPGPKSPRHSTLSISTASAVAASATPTEKTLPLLSPLLSPQTTFSSSALCDSNTTPAVPTPNVPAVSPSASTTSPYRRQSISRYGRSSMLSSNPSLATESPMTPTPTRDGSLRSQARNLRVTSILKNMASSAVNRLSNVSSGVFSPVLASRKQSSASPSASPSPQSSTSSSSSLSTPVGSSPLTATEAAATSTGSLGNSGVANANAELRGRSSSSLSPGRSASETDAAGTRTHGDELASKVLEISAPMEVAAPLLIATSESSVVAIDNYWPMCDHDCATRNQQLALATNALSIDHVTAPLRLLRYRSWCALPAGLVLTNVAILNLSRNEFKTIPIEICSLRLLRMLNMSFNCLESLTPRLIELEKLEMLNLARNKLNTAAVMCVHWDALRNLQILSLLGNKIDRVPPSLIASSVSALSLSENEIVELPREMKNMKNLRWLGLQRNKIESIEVVFARTGMLRGLTLTGNPLRRLSALQRPKVFRLAKILVLEPDKEMS